MVSLIDGDDLVIAASRGVATRMDGRRPISSSVARFAFAERGTLLIEDATTDPRVNRTFQQAIGDTSMICVPLFTGDTPFAVLNDSDGFPGPVFAMVRAVLAERFGLVTHNEARERAVYARIQRREDFIRIFRILRPCEMGEPGREQHGHRHHLDREHPEKCIDFHHDSTSLPWPDSPAGGLRGGAVSVMRNNSEVTIQKTLRANGSHPDRSSARITLMSPKNQTVAMLP